MTREKAGLVGLGLMGRGIATCLVAHGFSVAVYDRLSARRNGCRRHIGEALAEMASRGLLKKSALRNWERRFQPVNSMDALAGCSFVVESVHGFYRYTPQSARQWERGWVEFTYDVRKLVDKYDKLVRS